MGWNAAKYKHYEHDAKRADVTIKYCSKCRRCWETSLGTAQSNGKKRINTLYYENFVSYGKEREICKQCKGE